MLRRPSRRRFLESGAALGAGSIAGSSCGHQAVVTPGVCFHDCPDACAWTVTRENSKLVRLPAYLPAAPAEDATYPSRLLTSKAASHFLNSSHAGVARAAREEGRPFVRMHPTDAASRGIRDGVMVRVFNERGSVLVPVEVTNSVRAGLVAMSHGWWASRMPGKSSANALVTDGLSDAGGGGDFNDARVQAAMA